METIGDDDTGMYLMAMATYTDDATVDDQDAPVTDSDLRR